MKEEKILGIGIFSIIIFAILWMLLTSCTAIVHIEPLDDKEAVGICIIKRF